MKRNLSVVSSFVQSSRAALVALAFLATLGFGARQATAVSAGSGTGPSDTAASGGITGYPFLSYEWFYALNHDFMTGKSLSDWKQTDSAIPFFQFGAGYALGGHIRAQKAARVVEADANAYVSIMLFGETISVASARGHGRADTAGGAFDATVTVLGYDVLRVPPAASFNYPLSYSATLFETKKTFWVGGLIPVSIKVTATGELGLTVSGDAQPSQLAITMTPNAGIWGHPGVGLDAEVVGGWVVGNLQLVDLALPVTAHISAADGANLAWGLNVDLVISTLKGYLSFDWAAGPVNGSFPFFNWEGLSWTQSLYSWGGAEAL